MGKSRFRLVPGVYFVAEIGGDDGERHMSLILPHAFLHRVESCWPLAQGGVSFLLSFGVASASLGLANIVGKMWATWAGKFDDFQSLTA